MNELTRPVELSIEIDDCEPFQFIASPVNGGIKIEYASLQDRIMMGEPGFIVKSPIREYPGDLESDYGSSVQINIRRKIKSKVDHWRAIIAAKSHL